MSRLTDLIRKKYPGQYDDMDDITLEKAVLTKYPDYADLVEPEPITEPTITSLKETPLTIDKQPEQRGFRGPWWNPIYIPEGELPERQDTSILRIKPPQAETWWGGFANSVIEQASELLTDPLAVAGGFGTKLLRGKLPSIAKSAAEPAKMLMREDIPITGRPTNVIDEAIDAAYANARGSEVPQEFALPKPKISVEEAAANLEAGGQMLPNPDEIIGAEPLNWQTDPVRLANMKKVAKDKATGKFDPSTLKGLKKTSEEIPTANIPNKPPPGDIVNEMRAMKIPNEKVAELDRAGKLQQGYDLLRGLMSVDPPFMTSAAFRQAGKYVGTTEWFKAWVKAAKAFGSKATADVQEAMRLQRPLFKPTRNPITNKMDGPSYADQVGLRRGSLNRYSRRDEAIKGDLAEKVPIYGKYVASSNRAYNAFINHIADTKLEEMVNTAAKLNRAGKLGGITGNLFSRDITPNPLVDLTAGKKIADFINTSLGRGKLGVEVGNYEVNLERGARILSNTFFSPRMYASTVRMLNPSTYIMAPPQIRKEYLAAMIRQVALWWSMAELAEWGGAYVSKEPTSADFGKIKIGDMRIDPPGGLQQYLVLGARNLPESLGGGGVTSTTTGKFTPFGEGYKPETRATQALQFGINRLHPTAKVAWDIANAQKKAPFHVMDRALQAVLPMYADDLANIIRYNPDIASFILGGLAAGSGMGTQAYERGSFGKPVFIPERYDLNIGR